HRPATGCHRCDCRILRRHLHCAALVLTRQDYPMSYILRTIVTAASFWVALWLLPGMQLTSDTGAPDTGESIIALLIISVVFGLINGVVRPIVSFLSLPITCLTLGLFTLVINAAMLSLTVWATSFL